MQRRVTTVLVALPAVALAVQLWFVNQRVIDLGRRLDLLERRLPSPARLITVGDTLNRPRIDEGKARKRFPDLRESKTLLVFLSPRCGACTMSMPQLRAVASRLAGRTRIVAIGGERGEDFARYVKDAGLNVDAFAVPAAWLTESGFMRTPTTALVSEAGFVQQVWIGAPTQAAVEEIVATASG